MNQQQRKHLKERLDRAQMMQRCKENKTPPKAVIAAKKVIKIWEDAQYKIHKKERQAVDDRASKVREILLFGDAKQALAAVKAFERGA